MIVIIDTQVFVRDTPSARYAILEQSLTGHRAAVQVRLGVRRRQSVRATERPVVLQVAGSADGESLNRLGPRRRIVICVSALILTSIACALAGSLPWLLAFRFIQGLAAGAATIVAPDGAAL